MQFQTIVEFPVAHPDPMSPIQWCCYVIECVDGALYVGMTCRFQLRMYQHSRCCATSAKFAHTEFINAHGGPLRVVRFAPCESKAEASRLEREAHWSFALTFGNYSDLNRMPPSTIPRERAIYGRSVSGHPGLFKQFKQAHPELVFTPTFQAHFDVWTKIPRQLQTAIALYVALPGHTKHLGYLSAQSQELFYRLWPTYAPMNSSPQPQPQ